MAWLRAADTEVKRDMEISRNEVRVMTVHGAKGLEAPVVFLVDTTTSPSDTQRLRLIHLPQGNAVPNAHGVVVWAGRKADDPTSVASARSAMLEDTEDEYRRLLYVAMTRAADRLIVGGCMPGNRGNIRPQSWYDLIDKGLTNSGLQVQEFETAGGKVKRYSRPEDAAVVERAAVTPTISVPTTLPSWLRTSAPPEAAADNLLRPSDPAEDEGHPVRTSELIRERARALQRGTLVHRLLQSLPEVDAAGRRDAAQRYLDRNAAEWSEAERAALASSVLDLIADSRFAEVFAAGSRAEVSIVGRLARTGKPPALVSGQIDRLVVTPNEVLIVDFKTNHAPPRKAAEAPAAYVRQLALYRAVLSKLTPDRPVRAALLWTEIPELMEISGSVLDAALASYHAGYDHA
jgi:ATP-dependent helicase/nuclease subunit A